MLLKEKVSVVPRFQRAIRIDTDFGTASALEGFICPESLKQSLDQICSHIEATQQAAFTWTGPYGCGKSTLAIAFGAILDGPSKTRNRNAKYLAKDLVEKIWSTLPPKSRGWHVLPIVGRREMPHTVIAETLTKLKLFNFKKDIDQLTEEEVLASLLHICEQDTRHGGILVLLDEMGKYLEHSAEHHQDIYFFQQLGELASRSNKKLLVVGILHQSFEEYAGSLTKKARDEWAKIQGRYIDIPINIAGEEQIELIAQAIQSAKPPKKQKHLSQAIGQSIIKSKPGVSAEIIDGLYQSWPLHPVVTCLLGPISRRRFGQNQRSIFGFLNSAEPMGFQDFIKNNEYTADISYTPTDFWEYLRSNLEPVILASPDSHRWSLAIDAAERAESFGALDHHLDILKLIALITVFSERSGLEASTKVIQQSLPELKKAQIESGLKDLEKWSIVVFRKHLQAYALFAGSDFDFEKAFQQAAEKKPETSALNVLQNTVKLKPILAKRFYDKNGSQRWFDINILPLSELEDSVHTEPLGGSIGQFLYVINDTELEDQDTEKICIHSSCVNESWINVVGTPVRETRLKEYADELSVLDHIWNEFPELSSDSVARREIEFRTELIQSMLQIEFQKVFANSLWFVNGEQEKGIKTIYDLSLCASRLADDKYPSSPIIKNELINRDKPSASAVSAQKKLLKHMVLNEGKPRLGIIGHPAEWGIWQSILVSNGLYQQQDEQWQFTDPEKKNLARIYPLWQAALSHLRKNKQQTVSVGEIYELWSQPPFGVKRGLLPILVVALIQSQRKNLAFYRENIFQSHFTDLDIDYLTNDPASIQLRWMDLDQFSKNLLSGMSGLVEELDQYQHVENADPLTIARSLIAIFDRLHPWTGKTQRLSKSAKEIRTIFKKASDPNQFLFDDLPAAFGNAEDVEEKDFSSAVIHNLKEGLGELIAAYPSAMEKLRSQMFEQLQVYSTSTHSLQELQERANNVTDLSGKPRMEAYIMRLKTFDIEGSSMDELASLAINKPTRDWVDNDFDRALIELIDLAQQFVRLESFAHVKGRKNNQSSLSIVVGSEGQTDVYQQDFLISKNDKQKVDQVKLNLKETLQANGKYTNKIVLSALAEIGVELMQDKRSKQQTKAKKQ